MKERATGEHLEVFLGRRGEMFREVIPLAMRNLAIAQQRDRERYKRVRGAGWDRPKAEFKVGDFVLLRRPRRSTLDGATRLHIVRVVERKESGVVVLGGRDASRMEEHVRHIAHCQVPIEDTRTYPELFTRGETLHCQACGSRKNTKKMVLCDMCKEGYHLGCLEQPLERVFCPLPTSLL